MRPNSMQRQSAQTIRRRAALSVACLVIGLTLIGCTPVKEYIHNGFKVGPNYGRPPAPIAEDWIDAHDVRIRKSDEEPAQWWSVFGDPVLDCLVGNAYLQNISLREAGFRVLHARAELGIACGNLLPQDQNANGSALRRILSVNIANREGTVSRFFSQYNLGFALSWELDFWGRYRRTIESAAARLDASVDGYDGVLVTLIGDVAAAYINLRTLERQIELARINVQLQTETLKIAQARFKGGQTSELDVDQASSTLAQTEALIPQLEIALRQNSNRLCVLLGIPLEDLRKKLGPGVIPTAPAEVVVGIPADLIRQRPDVRRVEREAAAQCALIGVAEADFYPSLSLTGTLSYQAQFFPHLISPRSVGGQYGPGFKWDILNYCRILNNVLAQDARFQELVARYQQTVLNANGEVENGLVAFLKSQDQARYLGESVKAAEKAVKAAVAQYKGGLVDFNRVALLQQNLVDQQDQLAQAQGAIAQGLVQVYRSLGGGWQIRLTDCKPAVLPGAQTAEAATEATTVVKLKVKGTP